MIDTEVEQTCEDFEFLCPSGIFRLSFQCVLGFEELHEEKYIESFERISSSYQKFMRLKKW